MNKTNQILWVLLFVLVVLLSAVATFYLIGEAKPAYSNLDEFAKCLSDSGAVLYGASWCPHCLEEKNSFSKSFQYINYVECPDNIEICTSRGIMSYPSWIFGDGKKSEGRQGLERLSRETGCELRS
jgi:thiol-disulfide isomerase/thioredoxin